jgi:putative membrane protein
MLLCSPAHISERGKQTTHMKTQLLLCAFALSVFTACDKDDDDDNMDLNNTDREFVLKASLSNYAEIDAGQLAVTKAEEDGVEMYGQHMVTDHSLAKAELETIAASLGLRSPDSLDARHVALKAVLMSLSDRAFDSAYIISQVQDHQEAIDLFENEADDGDNSQLRNYANGKLPHLRRHLQMADSIANAHNYR